MLAQKDLLDYLDKIMNPIQQKIKESLEEFVKTFGEWSPVYRRLSVPQKPLDFLEHSQLELLEVIKREIEKKLDLPPPFSAIEEMPIKHVFQNEGYNKGLQDVLDLLNTESSTI